MSGPHKVRCLRPEYMSLFARANQRLRENLVMDRTGRKRSLKQSFECLICFNSSIERMSQNARIINALFAMVCQHNSRNSMNFKQMQPTCHNTTQQRKFVIFFKNLTCPGLHTALKRPCSLFLAQVNI